jgi:hypothetical protein
LQAKNNITLSPEQKAWWVKKKQTLLNEMGREYPGTPEEAFEAAEGVAFGEFSYDIHVCKPLELPKHWRKWRSVDNGYTDAFAWYWYAVDDDGKVYVYREYTRNPKIDNKVAYSDQAKKVKSSSGNESVSYTVAGHDAFAVHNQTITTHTPQGKSIIDYYTEGGVSNFVRAITDRTLRKATIHEYLKPYLDTNTGKMTARVQIFDTCEKLIETLPQLINDEKDNEKYAECDYDHWADSFGYGLLSYHAKRSELNVGFETKHWTADMWSDYNRASEADKIILTRKWGKQA